ncbi:MAG: proline racemase [Lysobacteraceae bacterium]|nr:MAG: proline racemase [Xanthomonadaceae bacterium]
MPRRFYQRFKASQTINIPAGGRALTTIDMHTGGEPLRIITGGYPQVAADSLLDYRQQLQIHHDWLRTSMMFEPRGHADMYGCLILPPFDPTADCSVILMHNEGYSTMCGHAVIAIMTLAAKMGWVDTDRDGRSTLLIEAPCGLIHASGQQTDETLVASFECVDSFVAELDARVYLPSLGREISYDLAYGGAFYAYVDADQIGLDLTPQNTQALIALGREIKACVTEQSTKIVHPVQDALSFLYGTIFTSDAATDHVDSRNVCIFADGEVDRSPTGSGVSGRMAIEHARGRIRIGEQRVIESIIGSQFRCHVARTSRCGPHAAVIPEVSGQAFLIGSSRFLIDPADPLATGFLLR